MIRKGCLGVASVVLFLAAISILIAWMQGRATPKTRPEYVALGSSFAAGAGLGTLQHASPWLCARSINGYPQQLARTLHLSIADMSCGGATAANVLNGGQFFQGPQVRTIDEDTRLVTITVGGNDINYIGDLSLFAARRSATLWGWLVRHFWNGPAQARDYPQLKRNLVAILRAIRRRAPQARIIVATYPAVLPQFGTCPRLQLSSGEADLMREVANQLAETSRSAAKAGGAIMVDMNALGEAHNACAARPWTNGWTNGGIAPFHPTLEGAQATAKAIAGALRLHQQV